VYRIRHALLGNDFGTHWPLVAVGVSCLVVAGWLRVRLARDITNAELAGLAELEPDRRPRRLVRTGLYGRVRHPRYMQIWIALLGYALIANYLGAYVIWLLWLPGIFVVTSFEERELRDRFGQEYEDYAREVPRFFPLMRRAPVRP
jgi:protein-S-isoprenylcysteine O-methyltransferase Ste14